MENRGRAVIRDYMPEQHRAFFAALPFMVVGMADQNGHPWPTTLSGHPGFVNSTEPNLLSIKAWLDADDPLYSCLRDGAPVGGLGIELSTRRRNRINGRIERCVVGEGFSIRVQQSFGNCPKYIQARNEQPRPRSTPVPKSRMASDLGDLYCVPVGATRPERLLARSRCLPPWRASRLRAGRFKNRTLLSGL